MFYLLAILHQDIAVGTCDMIDTKNLVLCVIKFCRQICEFRQKIRKFRRKISIDTKNLVLFVIKFSRQIRKYRRKFCKFRRQISIDTSNLVLVSLNSVGKFANSVDEFADYIGKFR